MDTKHAENSTTHHKEPLMSQQLPKRAWVKTGTDLFSYHGKEYLVTVCYKSNFWELNQNNNSHQENKSIPNAI